jgi:hypothetical protein
MSSLSQTTAAGKTAGLPTAGEVFDPDHDPALTPGAAACLAAVIIGGWPGGGRRQVNPSPGRKLLMDQGIDTCTSRRSSDVRRGVVGETR